MLFQSWLEMSLENKTWQCNATFFLQLPQNGKKIICQIWQYSDETGCHTKTVTLHFNKSNSNNVLLQDATLDFTV